MKSLFFLLGFICVSSYAQITPVGESLALDSEDSSFVKHLSASLEINAQWRDITSFVFKYAKDCMVITYVAPTEEVVVCVKNYELGDLFYIQNGEITYYPVDCD